MFPKKQRSKVTTKQTTEQVGETGGEETKRILKCGSVLQYGFGRGLHSMKNPRLISPPMNPTAIISCKSIYSSPLDGNFDCVAQSQGRGVLVVNLDGNNRFEDEELNPEPEAYYGPRNPTTMNNQGC